jgi:hypothetical protein
MTNKNMSAPPVIPFSLEAFGGNSTLPMQLGPAGMGGLVLLPLWVPPSLLRFVSGAPTLEEEDIERLQKQVRSYRYTL